MNELEGEQKHDNSLERSPEKKAIETDEQKEETYDDNTGATIVKTTKTVGDCNFSFVSLSPL